MNPTEARRIVNAALDALGPAGGPHTPATEFAIWLDGGYEPEDETFVLLAEGMIAATADLAETRRLREALRRIESSCVAGANAVEPRNVLGQVLAEARGALAQTE